MDDLKILQAILNKLENIENTINTRFDETDKRFDRLEANQKDMINEISNIYMEVNKTNEKLDKIIEPNNLKIWHYFLLNSDLLNINYVSISINFNIYTIVFVMFKFFTNNDGYIKRATN